MVTGIKYIEKYAFSIILSLIFRTCWLVHNNEGQYYKAEVVAQNTCTVYGYILT